MQRRALLAAALGTGAARHAFAQGSDYPSRPTTMVIGYAAGGLTDTMTRLLAERMARELGQQIVVENRAGAATSIASAQVAQAKPDGYTLLMGTTSLAINPALQPTLAPRDPQRELLPIGLAYQSPFALLVRSSLGVQNLAEFIAHAKANPDRLSVASSGIGSVNHLLLELFNRGAGVKLTHVPYKGAAPAIVDLRGGRIDATFATPLDAVPVTKDGAGRILAVTSAERLALLPDVPTVAQTLRGFNGVFWQGLFAPAGTPEPVQRRLTAALRAATDDAELRAKVAERGVTLNTGGPDVLRKLLADESELWGKLIRDANIKPE
jgi:tripartite-type tricarboxylate transporter receptor subunit TctC